MAAAFRSLSIVFLLVAMIALAADVLAWQQTGVFSLTTVGERWFELHSSSLQQAQPFVQRYLLPQIWDPILVEGMLLRPAALFFFILFALFIGVSRVLGRR